MILTPETYVVGAYGWLPAQETRFRQRYLDLMVNAEVREVFKTRTNIIRYIRRFFDNLNFIEVRALQKSLPRAKGACTFIHLV